MTHYTFDFRGLKRDDTIVSSGQPAGPIVHISTKLPDTVKFRITQFRTGVQGTARLISSASNTSIAEFTEGTYLDVFFPDGGVIKLERKKSSSDIVAAMRAYEQAAIARVNLCVYGLNRTGMTEEQRIRLEDAIVYQIELIYRFGTDKIQKFVMDFVYRLVEEERVGIRKPFQQLLGTLRQTNTIHYHGLNQLLVA